MVNGKEEEYDVGVNPVVKFSLGNLAGFFEGVIDPIKLIYYRAGDAAYAKFHPDDHEVVREDVRPHLRGLSNAVGGFVGYLEGLAASGAANYYALRAVTDAAHLGGNTLYRAVDTFVDSAVSDITGVYVDVPEWAYMATGIIVATNTAVFLGRLASRGIGKNREEVRAVTVAKSAPNE